MAAGYSLKDVAESYVDRLPLSHHQQLLEAVEAYASTGKVLKIGTMCSGTDSPVPVLLNLAKALNGKLQVEHTFSCELCPKKQQWITDNFKGLKFLFGDVKELQTGRATNYITRETVDVPAVDIVLAGFVCKSVSFENTEREKYANCINDASGKTGETFDGVMGYVRRYKPSLVICENVEGLVKRNKGAEPVIHHVRDKFVDADYGFEYRVLDSRDFLLPQRRHRCWMWAFRGAENQGAAELAAGAVESLRSEKAWQLDDFFDAVKATDQEMKRPLNERERDVVRQCMQKLSAKQKSQDVLIDIAKSAGRAPFCLDAAACVVPNSRPFRRKTGLILSAEQVHAVQGIYKEDFPALERWCWEKEGLARDLAGNAFSTTVCMAVAIACLAHGPLPGLQPPTVAKDAAAQCSPLEVLVVPSTPPPSSNKRSASITPPREPAANHRVEVVEVIEVDSGDESAKRQRLA